MALLFILPSFSDSQECVIHILLPIHAFIANNLILSTYLLRPSSNYSTKQKGKFLAPSPVKVTWNSFRSSCSFQPLSQLIIIRGLLPLTMHSLLSNRWSIFASVFRYYPVSLSIPKVSKSISFRQYYSLDNLEICLSLENTAFSNLL